MRLGSGGRIEAATSITNRDTFNITGGEIRSTGTSGLAKIGDKVEYEALQTVFQGRIPPVSANKSMIGHAMGASSAIETIFAIEGMRRETLLPTINYRPDPELPLDCVPKGRRPLVQEFLLKNAFGFGGCNACLVLKRVW